MKKYVISHKLQGKNIEYVSVFLDKIEMYLKTIEEKFYEWVDIFEADKFETFQEAQTILNSLPLRHTIVEIEMNGLNGERL